MAGAREVDLVVVGGGPAGEKAAAQAAYWGKKVALVEQRPRLGGTMAGVVSSKTMREAALYLTSFGFREVYDIGLELTPQAAMAHLRSRTDHVVDVVAETTEWNMRRHGVEVVTGRGRLGPSRTVTVERPGETALSVRGEVVLLAPGSSPFRPPGIAADDDRVLDADAAARLDAPLRDVVVVGGGAVGCEFASIFMALGADVTLVDSGPRLLPFMDAEISELLACVFRGAGMRVVQSAGRARIDATPKSVVVTLGTGERLLPERVIFAAGRTGNTGDLLADGSEVRTDDRGRILVDDQLMTSAAGVYAAGDVIGAPALASVSMEQARVAICNAFDLPLRRPVEEIAPFGVYAIPEVAMVGMTEQAAAADGVDCVIGRARFADNTRAKIAGVSDGLLKLVVDRHDLRIRGVHALGGSATELIHQGQMAVHMGATLEYFVQATYNVPTVSEAYKYAAYDALGAARR